MGEPKSPAPRNEPFVMRYKLVELFPPDLPDSPWLLRLMIIRDDLDHELRNVWLADDATVEDSWKSVYHIRRLAVSVHEAYPVHRPASGAELTDTADLACDV